MNESVMNRGTEMRKKLTDNLNLVRDNIAESAEKVGRDASKIHLLAVTKSMDMEVVRTLLELGQLDLAESRAQQLVQRAGMIQEYLKRRSILEHDEAKFTPRWHMIGPMQRNKAKAVVPLVSLTHSVDTLRLAEEINSQAKKQNIRANILLQVNASHESQKGGMPLAATGHFIEQIMPLEHLSICGLMTMAAVAEDPEQTRPTFDRMYEVFLEVKLAYKLGKQFEHLSMGMSQDYCVAIEYGATILRIGRALFEGIEASIE